MPHSIGVTITERITAGLVSGHTVVGDLRIWPLDPDDADGIVALPGEQIAELIRDEILALAKKTDKVIAIGIGIPGIVRHGTVEDSPNVPQLKGLHIREMVHALLKEAGLEAPIEVNNDADAIAAGIASTYGQMDKVTRVWTLGNGVGYGRFPHLEGIWEGGHTVVTLDSKETYCGCGGRGHLEGICGYRAMRLRFLDMEPEEVFAAAKPQGTKQGDPRCVEFVKMWHRALAAGTANSIHHVGPGKFYYTGFCVNFLDVNTLDDYLHQMVKMSPLQGYSLEVLPEMHEISVIGAAVAAEYAFRKKMPG